jgi:hypothetical protein
MPAVGSIKNALAVSTSIYLNGLVQARQAMLGVRGVDVQPMRPPIAMH